MNVALKDFTFQTALITLLPWSTINVRKVFFGVTSSPIMSAKYPVVSCSQRIEFQLYKLKFKYQVKLKQTGKPRSRHMYQTTTVPRTHQQRDPFEHYVHQIVRTSLYCICI